MILDSFKLAAFKESLPKNIIKLVQLGIFFGAGLKTFGSRSYMYLSSLDGWGRGPYRAWSAKTSGEVASDLRKKKWKHQALQGFLACSYAQSQQTESFFRVSLLFNTYAFFLGVNSFRWSLLSEVYSSRDGSLDFIIKSSTHWLLCQP